MARLDSMFIKNAQNETLWVRNPFFPVEKAAIVLADLEKQGEEGLTVGLSYVDSFGTEVEVRDITEVVRGVSPEVLELARKEEKQLCLA